MKGELGGRWVGIGWGKNSNRAKFMGEEGGEVGVGE